MIQTLTAHWYPEIRNSLRHYRIPAFDAYPNLTHAILTRQGGFSASPYHSLNLSVAVGDDPDTVARNFAHVCRTFDISPEETAASHLVHGNELIAVTAANQQRVMGKADGLMTNTPGIFLVMRFGDCTPLLFFDPVRRAIALMHAGWRGTMQNAAGATITAMQQTYGSHPADIIAVVGPAIGPCCYEVGPEVIAAADTAFAEPRSLFTRWQGDHAHFNLWEANRRQLAEAGVSQIVETQYCTACHPDEFFSHRGEHGHTGRFGVLLGLRERTA